MISTFAQKLLPALLLASICCSQSSWAQSSRVSDSRNSPAVTAILQLPRESPEQQLQAIFTLIDLGEIEVAVEQWNSFAELEMEDSTLGQLVAKFGTARYLKLARQNPEQFTGAQDFVNKSLEASARITRDPQRLAKLIQQLNDPSAEIRNAARIDLAATSTPGAVACLEALAASHDQQERTQLLLALLELRPEVDPLVVAVLAESEGQLRRDVCELAGHMRLVETMPWLAALVAGAETDGSVVSAAASALTRQGFTLPSPPEARVLIWSELRRAESGVSTSRRPTIEQDDWWTFDSKTGKLTSQILPRETRQLLTAERLAKLLLVMPEATLEDQRTALIYAYQAAQLLELPLEESLRQRVLAMGTSELVQALAKALEVDSVSAALALVKILGEGADPLALKSRAGLPSPLAQALKHPNRQLRFLTLHAVMNIKPQETFAGASAVAPALWFFATGAGKPQAIAASSQVGVAQDWAGQIRGMGFDTTPTVTGGETLREAVHSTRAELILIDSNINRPPLREVIYQLRSNLSTAHTPIAILSSLEKLAEARDVAQVSDRLLAVPRPHRPEAMEEIVARLQAMTPEEVTSEERTAQAAQALNWIADLLEAGHPYDELLRGADQTDQMVFVPGLTEPALRVLALLGTADSQRQLVDMASTGALPLETRKAAIEAFATSIQRGGILLSNAQLQQQYDRYNASEHADAGTQEVLGRILDILEAGP